MAAVGADQVERRVGRRAGAAVQGEAEQLVVRAEVAPPARPPGPAGARPPPTAAVRAGPVPARAADQQRPQSGAIARADTARPTSGSSRELVSA